MKIYEITQLTEISSGKQEVGKTAGEHSTEKGTSDLLHDPAVQQAVTMVPNALSAIESLLAGNRTAAAIQTVQALIPRLRQSPEALKSITDLLGDVYAYGKMAHHSLGATGAAVAAMPATMLAAPALAAGHEKEKINANPNAPEYANNPYAMTVRGQAPTIAAAGNQNRRATVQNFATAGNPVPQQESIDEIRRLAGQ
jgi:hypothetical protein